MSDKSKFKSRKNSKLSRNPRDFQYWRVIRNHRAMSAFSLSLLILLALSSLILRVNVFHPVHRLSSFRFTIYDATRWIPRDRQILQKYFPSQISSMLSKEREREREVERVLAHFQCNICSERMQ